MPIGEALGPLVALPADSAASPTVAAWAVVAKFAVALVARGRIVPAVSPEGIATWRVGPLDPADHRRLDELAAALPVEAHALAVPGSRPLRIRSPAACSETSSTLSPTASFEPPPLPSPAAALRRPAARGRRKPAR